MLEENLQSVPITETKMLIKFSPPAAPGVAKMTASGAADNEVSIKITLFISEICPLKLYKTY